MRGMRETLRSSGAIIWFAVLFFGVSFFAFAFLNKEGGDDLLSYYFGLNTKGPWPFFSMVLWLLYVVLFLRLALFIFVSGIRGEKLLFFFSRARLEKMPRALFAFCKDLFLLGGPLLLGFYVLSLAIGQLNLFNMMRLQDGLLLQWDFLLVGTYPSFTLASFSYPGWFVKLVEFAFLYLGAALVVFASYVFYAKRQLLQEAGATFFAALLVMFVGWTFFPALSPHDRFLDNVYGLSVPPLVQEYVNDYHPQEEIRSFLSYIRERKEGLSYLPTTTMPSAHVAWATLLAYYAWRAHRWLGLAVLPFALLSMLGTVLFAQHYFVDIPMGMLVSAGSILLVKRIIKKS